MLQGRDLIAAAKPARAKPPRSRFLPWTNWAIAKGNDRGPFMLIVTPTRELASQIADTCMPIGKHTHHFVGTFVGGVAYGPQIKKLERGLDVAIVTPGRMIDLMERGAADLSQVQVLVLDEADRMLDMGFWPQVQRIVEATPKNRQTLLFSATIDRSQDKTMFSILNDPAIVEIAHCGETADKVDQYVIKTTRRQKPELLNSFIKEKGGYRVIVFTRTRGGADNCCKRLRRIGIPAEAIHADRSQAQRSRALTNFREGKTNVLVATDVLARGIDVPEVDYVVNYDLPMMPEDYVHCIGRTGRAGADGFAVSLVTPDTRNLLRNIQKFTGQEIPEMNFEVSADAFEPVEGADERLLADDEATSSKRRRAAARKGRQKPRRRQVRSRQRAKEARRAPASATWSVPPSTSASSKPKRTVKSTFPPTRTTTTVARKAQSERTPSRSRRSLRSHVRHAEYGRWQRSPRSAETMRAAIRTIPSRRGGAKGKPGKRSRMANHDDRDLDGFRDERRGGGRVRKYNDRNGGKAWQLGYPAASLPGQLLRRRARQPRRTRQEVRRQAVLRRPRQQARQRRTTATAAAATTAATASAAKASVTVRATAADAPATAATLTASSAPARAARAATTEATSAVAAATTAAATSEAAVPMATTVAARAAIVPVAADVAKQGRDRFFFPQIHERAGQTTSPFLSPRPDHNPRRPYDGHAIKSFAIAHCRNIARCVIRPTPRRRFPE